MCDLGGPLMCDLGGPPMCDLGVENAYAFCTGVSPGFVDTRRVSFPHPFWGGFDADLLVEHADLLVEQEVTLEI